jgi:uncharacterized protein
LNSKESAMTPTRPTQMMFPVLPWWRVPTVWLVLGGPVSVVLACLVTAVFVIRGSDHVVQERELAVTPSVATTPAAPAEQGRNHVAATVR